MGHDFCSVQHLSNLKVSTDEILMFCFAALLQQNLLSLPSQSQTSLLQHQPGLALTPQVSTDHLLSICTSSNKEHR